MGGISRGGRGGDRFGSCGRGSVTQGGGMVIMMIIIIMIIIFNDSDFLFILMKGKHGGNRIDIIIGIRSRMGSGRSIRIGISWVWIIGVTFENGDHENRSSTRSERGG